MRYVGGSISQLGQGSKSLNASNQKLLSSSLEDELAIPEFPNILFPVRVSVGALPMLLAVLELPGILLSIRVSEGSP